MGYYGDRDPTPGARALWLHAEQSHWPEPTTDPADMLRDLVPEWFDTANPSAARMAMAESLVFLGDSSGTGLAPPLSAVYMLDKSNPDRTYPYLQFLKLALLTLDGFSPLADDTFAPSCNYKSSEMRARFRKGKTLVFTGTNFPGLKDDTVSGSIGISSTGGVSPTRSYEGQQAITYFGDIHLNKMFAMEATLADYFFLWAHRLWEVAESTCHARPLPTDYRFIAECCARAAVAEIVEVAGTLLHEYSHIPGSSYECTSWYTTVGGGNVQWSKTSPLNCCHFGMEYLFRNKLWARLGVPPSELVNGTTVRNPLNFRFGPGDSGPWNFTLDMFRGPAINLGTDCSPGSVTASHVGIRPGHAGTATWTIPPVCASGTSSGTVGFQ